MKFNISVVELPDYIHGRAFAELADLLCFGLIDLGHDAAITANHIDPAARNIVIGAHLVAIDDLVRGFPSSTIVINTEPLLTAERLWNDRIAGWAQLFEVWDYNPANAARLAALTGRTVRHLPLGYHPRLNRIAPAATQDTEVLFYGSYNARRRAIYLELEALGVTPRVLFGVYGAARDAEIARARLVLNIHADAANVFETVRVSYLMNNAKAVVTEAGPATPVAAEYADGVCAVPYEELAQACRALLDDDAARRSLEARALATLAKMPQAALLAPLLEH